MAADTNLQDYIDAASEATNRTKNSTIILIVATVVLFAGMLNSTSSNWMAARLSALQDVNSSYTTAKIGRPPQRSDFSEDESYKAAVAAYNDLRVRVIDAMTTSYVDNLTIKVPFFGFTIDVNDLGVVGGMAMFFTLIAYRFCLSREIDNVEMAFAHARRATPGQLLHFYEIMAMRQVFTVPRTSHRKLKTLSLLRLGPKLIPWTGVMIYLRIAWSDLVTINELVFSSLLPFRTRMLILVEPLLAVLLITISYAITTRLVRFDRLWDSYWQVSEKA